MSAPQQMLRQGEHPVYPPGYPEKNKILINPIAAEINRLMKTGMPFMFAAKQAMRAAAEAAPAPQ